MLKQKSNQQEQSDESNKLQGIINNKLNQWKYADSAMETKRNLAECIFYLPTIISLLIPNKEFIGIKREITANLLHSLTAEEVKKLYFKVVRILHPDKIPGKFADIGYIYKLIVVIRCAYSICWIGN